MIRQIILDIFQNKVYYVYITSENLEKLFFWKIIDNPCQGKKHYIFNNIDHKQKIRHKYQQEILKCNFIRHVMVGPEFLVFPELALTIHSCKSLRFWKCGAWKLKFNV